jgi:ribosomal protein S18 acetylase RimI-like enzyme
VRLRRATTWDYPIAGELTVEAYADFTAGPTDSYIDHLRDAETRDREAELWVATPDDREDLVMGTVTVCEPGSPWREIARDDEGEFRMLAVAPAMRGRGVGEALVRMCLDRFRADGYRGVAISTLAEMTAAHRIYERLGFVRDPSRDWSPLEGVHLIAFQTSLEDR